MRIEREIREYLGIQTIDDVDISKGFTIVDNATPKEYLEAIAIFNKMLSRTYIRDGILLCGVNDYLLTFNYKFQEIKKLYEYSQKFKLDNIQKYLGNFLLLCQFSIESKRYQEDDISYSLRKTFYDVFKRKDFYNGGKFINDSLEFMLDFTVSQKENIDIVFVLENIPKLFHRAKRDIRYQEILNCLLMNGHQLSNIWDYDNQIYEHQQQYNQYIIDNVNKGVIGGYEFSSSIDLLLGLNSKNKLSEEAFVTVLNRLIVGINNIVDIIKEPTNNVVINIHNMDLIISALGKIKSCRVLYKKYEEEIKKSHRIILDCKRTYIKSDKIKTGMREITHKFEIDHKVFADIEKSLLGNFQNLFWHVYVDFDVELEKIIRNSLDNQLLYLVSKVSIDTEKGTYFNWKCCSDTAFSRYYNKKGEAIIKELSDKMVNRHKEDYYYLMVQDFSLSFLFKGKCVLLKLKNLLEEPLKKYIVEEISGTKDEIFKDDYILCCYLILCIERVISEQMIKRNLTFEPNHIQSNLEKLFNSQINDKLARDVYMFVNYVLYDKYGLEYRNNFMHGNFVHKSDLILELMYIFACLVGLWIVEDRYEG